MIKVDRTFPAPKSLETEAKKKNGSYTEKDVVDQLLRDFHKKCYICEINDLQDPQVEHFRIRMENILKENLTGIIYSYLVVIAIVLRTRKNMMKASLIAARLILKNYSLSGLMRML